MSQCSRPRIAGTRGVRTWVFCRQIRTCSSVWSCCRSCSFPPAWVGCWCTIMVSVSTWRSPGGRDSEELAPTYLAGSEPHIWIKGKMGRVRGPVKAALDVNRIAILDCDTSFNRFCCSISGGPEVTFGTSTTQGFIWGII